VDRPRDAAPLPRVKRTFTAVLPPPAPPGFWCAFRVTLNVVRVLQRIVQLPEGRGEAGFVACELTSPITSNNH
jgi:hypothetical protein